MSAALKTTSKYLTVGAINSVVGYGIILLLLWAGLNPYFANAVGYTCGLCIGFLLNKSWVFNDTREVRFNTIIKYGLSFLLSYVSNLTVLYVLLSTAMPAPGAQLLAMATYSICFYFLLNFAVFKSDAAEHKTHYAIGEKLRSTDSIALIIFVGLATILWLCAPQSGTFWWSEAPRNALNGIFVLDLLKAMPFANPVEWAEAYYTQYPALTILFYPPMLHAMLAVWFFLFGISQFAANALMALIYLALLQGTYLLVKHISTPTWALVTALAVAATSQITFWASQVMLEVPMMAFLVWSLYFALLYLREAKTPFLIGFIVMALASLYTKQTSLIVIAVTSVFILNKHWQALLGSPKSLIAILFAAIALLPLLWIQLTYGSFNVTSVVSREDIGLSRYDLSTWSWYFEQLPQAMGWGVCAILLAGALGVIKRRSNSLSQKNDHFWLLLTITVATYGFFTLISLKEHRHGIPLYICLVLFFAPQIRFLLPNKWLGKLLIAGLAVLTLFQITTQKVPAIHGYNDAAEWLNTNASNNDRIVFSGNRDGHFIFNMRAKNAGKDLRTIRADKLFLNINIMPELGLNASQMTETEILILLQEIGVRYVATIDRFWVHEPVMQNFSNVLASTNFSEVKRIKIEGSPSSLEKELVIYKANYSLPENPKEPQLRLETINRTIAN